MADICVLSGTELQHYNIIMDRRHYKCGQAAVGPNPSLNKHYGCRLLAGFLQ